MVTAIGAIYGAGIGGGRKGKGGNVTITGGTIIIKNQSKVESRTIGPGYECDIFGTLTIGDAIMVGAGNDGSVERIYDADERVNACWYRSYAEISPCTHPGATYTVNGTTHTMHCRHCTTQFEAEPHESDETGECIVCRYKGDVYTVAIYVPDANNDDTYSTDGAYKTYTYNMVAGTSFTLPGAPQDLFDMEFAGWLVTTGTPSFSTYKASASENLLTEKAPYTLEGNVNFVARYKDIAISLPDDGDNSEKLYTYNGRKTASVTLAGCKLWKDGDWNTLCLPFSLASLEGTPLADATIKTLVSSSFDSTNGTLSLNFTADENNLTAIEAGKPYIVKWADTDEYIESPAFTGVTIDNSAEAQQRMTFGSDYVTFVGTYSHLAYTETDQSVLFLGAGNKLYYPEPKLTNPSAEYNAEANPYVPVTIGSFRAYFQLNGITAGDPALSRFVLNFGDDKPTGIETVQCSMFHVHPRRPPSLWQAHHEGCIY